MWYSLASHRLLGLALALASLPSGAVTEVEWEALAEKGGAYLAAIVMVQEFKRTSCGPMLNIGKKWLDMEAAEAEVRTAFPVNRRGELSDMHQMLSSKRVEFRNLFADPRMPSKCAVTGDFVWRQFDTAVTEWRAKRAQLTR